MRGASWRTRCSRDARPSRDGRPKRFPDNWIAHSRLGYSHLAAGEYADAEAATRTALALSGNLGVGLQLAEIYARTGRHSQADSILRLAESRSRIARVRPSDLAGVYVALGNKDKAFEHLARAIETHDASDFHAMFQLDPLRDDPRYKALLKKARLAPF